MTFILGIECQDSRPDPLSFSLIVNTLLWFYSLPEGMFYLLHLCNRVGPLDHLRVGIPPCQDQVHQRRLVVDDIDELRKVYESEFQGIVDLIQDQDIKRP